MERNLWDFIREPCYQANLFKLKMGLSYRNNFSNEILLKNRNIQKFKNNSVIGKDDTLEVELTFEVDVIGILNQADVFAQQLILDDTIYNLKRFVSPYEQDWRRILTEVYVYSYVRAVYFGINMNSLNGVADQNLVFPGHALLARTLAQPTFSYSYRDNDRNYSLNAVIKYESFSDTFKALKDVIPEPFEAESSNSNALYFYSSEYDKILSGLKSSIEFVNSKGRGISPDFAICEVNDTNIASFAISHSNPFLNSFLSSDGKEFYFVNQKEENIRFTHNESFYFSRSVGLRSKQLSIDDNPMYTCVKRDADQDFLTCEDVYATTGLKVSTYPVSMKTIKGYLSEVLLSRSHINIAATP